MGDLVLMCFIYDFSQVDKERRNLKLYLVNMMLDCLTLKIGCLGIVSGIANDVGFRLSAAKGLLQTLKT